MSAKHIFTIVAAGAMLLAACGKKTNTDKDMNTLSFNKEQAAAMTAIACHEARGDQSSLAVAIARGGHTLLYLWTDSSCSWQYYPRHGYEQVGFGRVPEYSTADEEYTYRLFRKNITQ